MGIKINARDKYEELFKFVPQEKWGDLNKVIEEYTEPNHDVAKYQAPGSIE